MKVECCEKMVDVGAVCVANYKVINHQGEPDVLRVVHPEPGHEWAGIVTMQGQELLQLDIDKLVASLW